MPWTRRKSWHYNDNKVLENLVDTFWNRKQHYNENLVDTFWNRKQHYNDIKVLKNLVDIVETENNITMTLRCWKIWLTLLKWKALLVKQSSDLNRDQLKIDTYQMMLLARSRHIKESRENTLTWPEPEMSTTRPVCTDNSIYLLAFVCTDDSINFTSHSEHRFQALSYKLCQIWLRHWRGTLSPRSCPLTRSAPSERFGYWSHSEHRFPAPSFKLPDLVMPLKGYVLFITAQLSSDAVSAPPKGSGTNMTVETT